jgi:hypothetical protein
VHESKSQRKSRVRWRRIRRLTNQAASRYLRSQGISHEGQSYYQSRYERRRVYVTRTPTGDWPALQLQSANRATEGHKRLLVSLFTTRLLPAAVISTPPLLHKAIRSVRPGLVNAKLINRNGCKFCVPFGTGDKVHWPKTQSTKSTRSRQCPVDYLSGARTKQRHKLMGERIFVVGPNERENDVADGAAGFSRYSGLPCTQSFIVNSHGVSYESQN